MRFIGGVAVVVALVSLIDLARSLPPVWARVVAVLVGAGAMFLLVFLWAWPASGKDE